MSTNLTKAIALHLRIPEKNILSWNLSMEKSRYRSQPNAIVRVTIRQPGSEDLGFDIKKVTYGDLLKWFDWEA